MTCKIWRSFPPPYPPEVEGAMAIRQWTQPDGDHFRGLCANEFWPVTDANGSSGGCNVCILPVANSRNICNCPPKPGIHLTWYIRISKIGQLNECWRNSAIGDFTLSAPVPTCRYESAERANGHIETLRAPLRTCFDFGSLPPFAAFPYEEDVPSGPFGSYPRWHAEGGDISDTRNGFARFRLFFNVWIVLYDAGIPYWSLTTIFQMSAIVPWCADKRGTAVLTHENTGFFGPQFTGIVSTHPIT